MKILTTSTYIVIGLLIVFLGLLYVAQLIIRQSPSPMASDTSSPVPTSSQIMPSETPSTTTSPTSATVTSSNQQVTFQYPATLPTKYIQTVDWPPQVQILNEPFKCTSAGSPIARGGQTEQITINGRIYCRTIVTEGAAGSIYNQYAYITTKDAHTLDLTFTLRATQCANYEDPQKTACETERAAFTPDMLLDDIAQSIQLKE